MVSDNGDDPSDASGVALAVGKRDEAAVAVCRALNTVDAKLV